MQGLFFAALSVLALGSTTLARTPALSARSTPPSYALTISVDGDHIAVDGTLQVLAGSHDGTLNLESGSVVRDLSAAVVGADGSERPVHVDEAQPSETRRTYALRVDAGPGEPITLHLRWHDEAGKHFVYSVRDDFAMMDGNDTAWYPQVPGDARAIGTLRFHVPSRTVVVASGTRSEAASQPGDALYTVSIPTVFAFVAAPFAVYESPGVPAVREYAMRPRSDAASYLAGARRVMTVLEELWGTDTYGSFSIVDVPDADAVGFSGASSAGMILVTSSFLNAPFNTAFFGHEMSHQWFGNLIEISDGLDEVMAQYSSLQVVSALDGPALAEQYRRTGYPGYITDQCARGYFFYAAAGGDSPLAALKGPATHDIGDSKGFLVVDLLAREVGRSRFNANLRTYMGSHRSQSVANRDLLQAGAAHGAADFERFWHEWFLRTGAPRLELSWRRRANTVSGTIAQRGAVYHIAMPLSVGQAGGTPVIKTIPLTGTRTGFVFTTPSRPTTVVVDPHFEVLHHVAAFDEEAAAMGHVTRGSLFLSSGKPDEAKAEFRAALVQPPMRRDAGVRFRAHYLLGIIAGRQHDWSAARDYLSSAVADPQPTKAWLPFAYVALVRADMALGDVAAATRAADAARQADIASGGTAGIQDVLEDLLHQKPTPSPSSSP
jgi:hypothetical protein